MARDKTHNFTLYLRPHCAKIFKHHCPRIINGVYVVRDSTTLGSLIWSQIVKVDHPVQVEYKGLPVAVNVQLACKYKRGVEWRSTTWHIDRPSMIRLDKWINDLFTWTIYCYMQGMEKPNKAKAVRYWMEVYQLSEDDVKYETVYMDLRRKEKEAEEKGSAALKMPRMA